MFTDSNTNKRINHEKLTRFVQAAFEKLEVPKDDAQVAAETLVAADLRGVDTHGVIRFSPHAWYVKWLSEGSMTAKPNIRVISETPSTALLDGVGLTRYFEVVFGGDSLAERKPSPMMLVEAARRCGAKASECLMVGDSRVDVEAGRAANMKTCGYVPGFRGRTELVDAGVDYVIERFGELCALVECARSWLPNHYRERY